MKEFTHWILSDIACSLSERFPMALMTLIPIGHIVYVYMILNHLRLLYTYYASSSRCLLGCLIQYNVIILSSYLTHMGTEWSVIHIFCLTLLPTVTSNATVRFWPLGLNHWTWLWFSPRILDLGNTWIHTGLQVCTALFSSDSFLTYTGKALMWLGFSCVWSVHHCKVDSPLKTRTSRLNNSSILSNL